MIGYHLHFWDANQLWDKFKKIKQGIVFHRGSKTVDHIENQFKVGLKKKEGIRLDINKWSPADIYVTTPGYDSKCLEDEQSIIGIESMYERKNKSTETCNVWSFFEEDVKYCIF